ncbi:hypothetical protein WJX74_009887 [Apatococcus lobatus]|uniref:glycerophosphodiester phosphodiesterase n=1 Tax=Apatococcus lobatus TaxID=904363 RepID=A0AAW1QCJ9_9CHLO
MRASLLPAVRVVSPKSPPGGDKRGKLYQLVYPSYLILVCIAVFVLYTKVLGQSRPSSRLLGEEHAATQSALSRRLQTNAAISSCSIHQEMQVCSHQAAGGELEMGTGSLQALQALWQAGVYCYDMDVVASKDGHLLVTHPNRIQEALAANQTFSNETDVQNLELQELRDRGLSAATFPEADELVDRYTDYAGDAIATGIGGLQLRDLSRTPLLFLELKGRAFNAAAVSYLSNTVNHIGFDRSVALFLVSDAQQEQLAAEGFEWKALSIRGYLDSRRTATGALVPEKPVIQQELVGRHELVGPSIKLPQKFFEELNDKTGGQPAYVWNVDDVKALKKAISVGAKGVISNQPLAMQAELNKLRAQCSKQASVA